MILDFTDEEYDWLDKWVDMEKAGWPYKEGCPPEIREKLEEKLRLVREPRRRPEDRFSGPTDLIDRDL